MTLFQSRGAAFWTCWMIAICHASVATAAPSAPAEHSSPAFLAGRRVCVDPGHGGPYPGALGPTGELKESVINLKVALALRELLERAGATVILTREQDCALNPESLSDDLEARAQVANRFGADVFVSIHHNAETTRQEDLTGYQIFHQIQDDGPSVRLGQCMLEAFKERFLGQPRPDALQAGNYRVLRSSRIPAVLTEISFLTNTRNIKGLTDGDSARSEATAVYQGLARYFASDPPRVGRICVIPDTDQFQTEVMLVFDRGFQLDLGSVAATVNGAATPGRAVLHDGTLRWMPHRLLPNGSHQLQLSARNVQGAPWTLPFDLTISRPPARLAIAQLPNSPRFQQHNEMVLAVRVLDAMGYHVANHTYVTLVRDNADSFTQAGVAEFHLRDVLPNETLVFRSGCATASFTPRFGNGHERLFRVVDSQTGIAIPHVRFERDGAIAAESTQQGWVALTATNTPMTLLREGYTPAAVVLDGATRKLLLEPVAQGVLHGRTIVLDPALGGHQAGAIGPNGTRGSDVSLDVAQQTAQRLRSAGAHVILTRTADTMPTDRQRVLLAETAQAEVYVALSFGGPGERTLLGSKKTNTPPRSDSFVGHYPASSQGRRLAQIVASELGSPHATPCVAYVVVQTGCPAVLVQPATVARAHAELQYQSKDARVRTAEGLYQAILGYFTEIASG